LCPLSSYRPGQCGIDTGIPAMVATVLLWSFAIIVAALTPSVAAQTRDFNHFFPEYGAILASVRDESCAAELAAQRTDPGNRTDGLGPCPVLLSCILSNTPEAIKSNMASSSVLLGLMPAILITLSSSSFQQALIAHRRPILAFLIACGSPVVNPLATFEYPDPLAALRRREELLFLSQWRDGILAAPLLQTTVMLAEYAIVLGAVANTISTYYQCWNVITSHF
jgi:hypothetical protein